MSGWQMIILKRIPPWARRLIQALYFLHVLGSIIVLLGFLVEEIRISFGVGRYGLAVFVLKWWFPGGVIVATSQFLSHILYTEKLKERIKTLRDNLVELKSDIYEQGLGIKEKHLKGDELKKAISGKYSVEQDVGWMSMARTELEEAGQVLIRSLKADNLRLIVSAAEMVINRVFSGNKIITCGNGESQAIASHLAERLSSCFPERKKGLPAISISDPVYISSVADNLGFEHVFSQFVSSVGMPGDILFVFAGTGNEENVVRAVQEAKEKSMKVVAFLGNEGGRVRGGANVEILVPYTGQSDRIQEMHIKIVHVLALLVEKMLSVGYKPDS
ncbi:MAG: SIS domain-containing protein [Cytophagales bacterium]|nr:SIS domain-containing protein [Cytophagales bacterium]